MAGSSGVRSTMQCLGLIGPEFQPLIIDCMLGYIRRSAAYFLVYISGPGAGGVRDWTMLGEPGVISMCGEGVVKLREQKEPKPLRVIGSFRK